MNFMTSTSGLAAAAAIPSSLTGQQIAMRWIDAAFLLLPTMEAGTRIDATILRTAMTEAFKGSDAEGAWDLKTAYDVCEVASAVGGVNLEPADAHAALMEGKTHLSLTGGLQLRRARVMGTNRIELSGFDDSATERLKAFGLFHEIISWKLRFFVPVSHDGIDILAEVLHAYPIERVTEKEAA